MVEQDRRGRTGDLPLLNIGIINKEPDTKHALRLSIENDGHINVAAELLIKNKIGVIAFNGIYGLFANADDKPTNDKILQIKNRPQDKNLVLVSIPEYLGEHVDFKHSHYSHKQVAALQKYLHALGVILPADKNVPNHLALLKDGQKTVLSIWTEYEPLRKLMTVFREKGGKAWVGTSANKANQPTHIETEEAWQDFKKDVDFILEANFNHLPKIRRQSTSVIDLTQPQPRLHRLGNVSQEEIQEALFKFGFPDLQVDPQKIIHVSPRK